MDGSLEKDINLEIARKLKHYLEASDVTVVMTREADRGLYGEKDSSKKMADMKNRCELINKTRPELVVSIHQNSYHEENKRLAKPNGNYYLLLHVKQPIVIVECGFLSNWKEAAALNAEEYQERLAWTIHMGIMEYLNGQ